jgi:SAM-dependent methyltransferase
MTQTGALVRHAEQGGPGANPNPRFYEAIAGVYDRLYREVDAAETVRQWLLLVRPRTGLPDLKARQLPRLLDAGCGTGRHLILWAAAGFRVTGIDASPAMIARAASRVRRSKWAARIRLLCADVRQENPQFARHGPFAAAVAHFNFLNLFPPGEVEQVLRSLRTAVTPGARLFTDCAPPWLMPKRGCERLDLGGGLAVEVRTFPDRLSGTVTRRYCYRGDWLEEKYWLHSAATLQKAAAAANWQIESVHGWQPDCRSDPWGPPKKNRGHRLYIFRAL